MTMPALERDRQPAPDVRPLPMDVYAERAVLGSLLCDPATIHLLRDQVQSAWFALEKHRWIWDAACAVAQHTPPVPLDLATLHDALRRHAHPDGTTRLDAVGGLPALLELAQTVPSASHALHYARIVQRTALHRQLIETGGRITALGYDETQSLDAIFAQADQTLFQVTQQRPGPDFEPIDVSIEHYAAYLDTQQVRPAGLLTGYHDLDTLLGGGLQPDTLNLLAARPGMGKTALGLCCALNMAQAGRRVGFISLEMSRIQVIERLVAAQTGVPLHHMRREHPDEDALAQVMDGLGHLANLQDTFVLDYEAGQALSRLTGKVQRWAAQGRPLDVVVVDYLQLVRCDVPHTQGNRVTEIGSISNALKTLALELHIPVLALSQLNRAVEQRVGRLPQLSDLRGSGDLEQDADVVLFLAREPRETAGGVVQVHVAKNRHGDGGVVPLYFNAPTTRFENLARRHHAGATQ